MKPCAKCGTHGTQAHYLNECPINAKPREVLLEGIPAEMEIPALSNRDFATLFEGVRSLEVKTLGFKISEEIMEPFARAVISSSAEFVRTTLSASSPNKHFTGFSEFKNLSKSHKNASSSAGAAELSKITSSMCRGGRDLAIAAFFL